MGEIGYNRHEFLYDLSYKDILCIERGYYRRNREMWSATRWQAFQIMRAQVGDDNLKKAGIHKPTDLIQFPWEKEPQSPLTEDEQQGLLNDMKAFEAILREKKAST